jgi:hypothetical protein
MQSLRVPQETPAAPPFGPVVSRQVRPFHRSASAASVMLTFRHH